MYCITGSLKKSSVKFQEIDRNGYAWLGGRGREETMFNEELRQPKAGTGIQGNIAEIWGRMRGHK